MGKKHLIDSNILIEFSARLLPEQVYFEISSIIDNDFNISFINKIEVLGHSSADQAWANFINQAAIIIPDDDIINQAISLRKKHKITIPDSIITATAIVNHLTLITRDVNDFKNIEDLQVDNPWLWTA
jgi:predicted nucleic acid-binding protein